MDRQERVLNLKLPAEPDASHTARDAVANFASQEGVAGDDLEPFLTALGEALANAVEHGRPTAKPIALQVRIGLGRISATVRDYGRGFAIDPKTGTTLPPPTSERGRGIPIIRRCSDVFTVKSAPGKGTAVTFGRNVHLPARFHAGDGARNVA
jgi:anti-sigma regulatory factor (Ser/Thr protein kinase)